MAKLTLFGKISRIIFILINILLSVIAAAVIGLGGYMVYISHIEGTHTAILATGYIFIVSGIVLLLLVLEGVLAAVFASRIVLAQYVLFVGVVIVLAVIGGVLAFVFEEKIATILSNNFNTVITQYHDRGDAQFKPNVNIQIDFLQSKAQCCGWSEAVGDWERAPFFITNNRFPDSCVCSPPGPCTWEGTTGQYIWTSVCKDSAVALFKGLLSIIGAFGTFTALILVLPVVLAMILIFTIKKNEYTSLTV